MGKGGEGERGAVQAIYPAPAGTPPQSLVLLPGHGFVARAEAGHEAVAQLLQPWHHQRHYSLRGGRGVGGASALTECGGTPPAMAT